MLINYVVATVASLEFVIPFIIFLFLCYFDVTVSVIFIVKVVYILEL